MILGEKKGTGFCYDDFKKVHSLGFMQWDFGRAEALGSY